LKQSDRKVIFLLVNQNINNRSGLTGWILNTLKNLLKQLGRI